jgi:hypothetical protein
VGGEVSSAPAIEQRRYVSSELFEEIAQCKALLRVKRKILHIPYRAKAIRPTLAFPVAGDETGASSRVEVDRTPAAGTRHDRAALYVFLATNRRNSGQATATL